MHVPCGDIQENLVLRFAPIYLPFLPVAIVLDMLITASVLS